MWSISSIINNTNPVQAINLSDGLPVSSVRGGSGNSFRLIVNTFGFLDFTDTGHQPNGPHYWQIVINGSIYWYDGQGAVNLTINNDGTFAISGDGNYFTGYLTPLPSVSEQDIEAFNLMLENSIVPYQLIPDEPGKTTAELQALGLQYFPFSQYSFQLAMAIYDWTTADFTRIQFMQFFIYTGIPNQPLDMNSIADGIWTSNWDTYNPHDKYYMNSFMMQPATTLQEVSCQLNKVASTLFNFNKAEVNLIIAALASLPRTSCMAVPVLYSGQVDISNLGLQHFATYFMEFPLNNNPNVPLEMPLAEALETFIIAGRQLTLKGFMSFTNSQADALHYSNGILVSVSPPPSSIYWNNVAYITPLSDGPEKTEYLYHPGSTFTITDISTVNIDGKSITEIYLQAI